ncbi:MAG: FAD-dependent oxidoreductase [Planctomycetota bacterium]|nr:MAG: FAD-dependent oxidoreductase [Planctomycetota bacterium]
MPSKTENKLVVEKIDTDVCIVGGGMSGICAAIASARNGAKTILIQDRPVLGGNASSEVRMWICGAHGSDQKEAGILEEILLENLYRNPGLKYTIWDHILYSKVQYQDNLNLLLNTSVVKTIVENDCIQSVKAWQLTTQKWLEINADLFIDCSGDSILRYSGAEFYRGRESKNEFGESLTVDEADNCTMGNSILIQLREVDEHIPFIPPDWAYKYTEEDLPKRTLKARANNNFWWLEIGGMQDTIGDAESIQDELLKMAYGVWDCIKNHPDGRGHQWELEWVGSLPGKRENIRYKGDKVLCQEDVSSGGNFSDMVAYGGWSMDDHHPEGINYKGAPTIFHKAPSPYGIPFRCLYSSNIKNLLFAGRNISTTHMALSSTRVMATCAIIGQAVGTAAAMSIEYSLNPRELYDSKISALQERLLDQDCYLPGIKRENKKGLSLKIDKDPQGVLINGIDRGLAGEDNGIWIEKNDVIQLELDEVKQIQGIRLIHDSDFKNTKRQPCSYPLKKNVGILPDMMIKEYQISSFSELKGEWQEILVVKNNVLRLDVQYFSATTSKLQLKVIDLWGGEKAHLFALDVF